MTKAYHHNERFEKIDFVAKPMEKGEYEQCTFVDCLMEKADLSGIIFSECEFIQCNMSLAKISQTAFRETQFKTCKLLGLPFENCNSFLFSVGFDHCFLNVSSFYKLQLKKIKFNNCSLHEVDFTEADLTQAVFTECDLLGATFDRCNLEKADFSSAFNYRINPEENRMKKAKFSQQGLTGLLEKYDLTIVP